MKLSIILALSLFVCSVSISSGQILKTKFQVIVIDNLGNYVEGATVTIYSSGDDYKSNTNELIIGKTDKKGKFQYKGLEAKSYFLDVRKDNLKNDGEGVQTGSLSEKKINKVIVVIK
ncbi:carboxypeptidase regulatory-like domain-containing protein [Ekhidna sp. To15]|uniref:carboxypeptidase regulatory-like domain-containing protein n=1 Tax=Ekhidna sp. To15 TaxID=3395267 RepID=UPI003F52565A